MTLGPFPHAVINWSSWKSSQHHYNKTTVAPFMRVTSTSITYTEYDY